MTDTIIVTTNIPTLIASVSSNTSTIIASAVQGPQGIPGVFDTNGPISNISLVYGGISSANYSSITIGQQVLDSFSYSLFGAAKYIIYSTYLTGRQICEILLLHDNFTVASVEYANIITSILLGTFTVDLNGGNVRLIVDSPHADINYKVIRTLISN